MKGQVTSICLRVLATSRGQVAAPARLPATKPAEKFAPRTLATLDSSPTKLNSLLLIYTNSKQKCHFPANIQHANTKSSKYRWPRKVEVRRREW